MGGPFEGQHRPVRFQEPVKWSISDDSQLTLATCESIIEARTVSPEHLAERFVQWFRARRITGVGASTLKALRDLDAGQHWALAGAKGEMAAGNGAAMRIAPLGFCLDPENAEDRQLIRDVCRITHHNEEAYVGALAVVTAVRSFAFDHSSPLDLLESALSNLPDSRVRNRITELNSLRDASIADVATKYGSSGYVVESVPLALYAARLIDRYQFDKVLRMIIEAGGDTDTNASITGQILGAWIGASQIPERLVNSLPNVNDIERIASAFVSSAEQATEKLFSYGTLQLEEVQLEIFGRKLHSTPDALMGYKLVGITITDEDFVVKSGKADHRNLQFTANASDVVEGVVLKLTSSELEQADAYEPEGYTRVRAPLRSGGNAWVFVHK